eukprot:TRINITY_DN52754_c0_g1_i3.p1 TRINITY_DN52754_c0_g1~~TRINITY_DN52754_c0_g1_i3.p1  ORF type:complete len:203 (-),score=41.60 TRINITY_DN52754_c0_g1_i3:128-736(-)
MSVCLQDSFAQQSEAAMIERACAESRAMQDHQTKEEEELEFAIMLSLSEAEQKRQHRRDLLLQYGAPRCINDTDEEEEGEDFDEEEENEDQDEQTTNQQALSTELFPPLQQEGNADNSSGGTQSGCWGTTGGGGLLQNDKLKAAPNSKKVVMGSCPVCNKALPQGQPLNDHVEHCVDSAECPICFKRFPSTSIERHASQCLA